MWIQPEKEKRYWDRKESKLLVKPIQYLEEKFRPLSQQFLTSIILSNVAQKKKIILSNFLTKLWSATNKATNNKRKKDREKPHVRTEEVELKE